MESSAPFRKFSHLFPGPTIRKFALIKMSSCRSHKFKLCLFHRNNVENRAQFEFQQTVSSCANLKTKIITSFSSRTKLPNKQNTQLVRERKWTKDP